MHGHLRAKSRRCASVALRNTSLRLGEKKRRLGAKRHGVPYLLMIRGSQQETLGGRIGVSVGRGPSSSQSPYPSLSAYAESSLIPTLVLSPRKPLRWVFAGAPVLLKFSAVRPRRTAFVRRRVQDRFDLLLPAAAALPTSNRPSRCQPGSAKRLRPQARAGANRRKAAALRRRQWEARKEKQGPYDDHPRKPHPRLQLRGSTSQFCLCRAHPVQTCKSGTHRLARPVSLFGKARGPPRKPSEAVFVGRGKRNGAVRDLPVRAGRV